MPTKAGRPGIRTKALWWSGLLLAVTVFSGWYFVTLFTDYGERLERNALLVSASTAAASFDGREVAGLTGKPDGPNAETLRRVQDSLRRITAAIPGSRFAYLMALQNGNVVFLADGEPPDSVDYSPPGEIYSDASPTLRLVFARGIAATEGPLSDHWGEWVSGLAPLFDPSTGKVVALFGVDIEAGHWQVTIGRFRWLGLAVTGFLAGVIAFFALLAIRQYRLRERLATASRIAENSTSILYRMAGQPTMPMTFISSNIARLGYQPREFLDAPLFYRDLVHPDDRATVEASERRTLENNASAEQIQFRVRAKNGEYHWFDNQAMPVKDDKGRVLFVEGMLVDITERRLADEKIRENEATLHGLVEQGISGIFIVGEDGKLLYINPQFAKMMGYEVAADFIGHPLIDFISGPDKTAVSRAMIDLIRGTAATVEITAAVLQKRGGTVDVLAQASVTLSGGKRAIIGVVMDITERKRAEQKLQFANTLLTTAFETSPDGILVVDQDARIVSSNKRFAAMWGISPEVIAAGDDAPVRAAVQAAMKDPAAFRERVQHLYRHPDEVGQDELEIKDGRFIERHTAVLQTAAGKYLGRVWFFRDVTDRRRAEAEVLHTARHDGLTGLANRRVFMEAVQQAIGRAARGDKSFAVLYLDLDHFKDVNDTLGHPAGDQLLQAVAARLRLNVRDTDLVARFGGDEFAVIATVINEPADAANLADKVVTAIGAPFSIEGNVIRSGVSIGIAVYESADADAETLLAHADVALYRAKADGRAGYRFFTDAMDAEVRTRVTLSAELREAIDSGQLFLQYQPQIEIETGRIIGVEALVRWRHPVRGILLPDVFVPVAEKTGLIVPLGRWVLREACRQFKAWLDAGIAPSAISVNVSAVQFKTALDLEKDIAAVLLESGLQPHRLELELTETVLMDASREHNDVLVRLRQAGVRFAIDDFGTGYSSLDYLRQYPADRVKIAQNFVRHITSDAGSAAIVKATIGLATELHMVAIAEGVETAEQLRALKNWGCREVQGYYFAKPLEPESLLPILRRGRIASKEAIMSQTAA